MAKTFSIGASYVTDVDAPVTLERADNVLYANSSAISSIPKVLRRRVLVLTAK